MTHAELAIIFAGLMGLAVFIYAIADGYDLGVGMLLPQASSSQAESMRDTMIASIGPFWDANETWLVLAVGILLIAFPTAHSIVLYQLYLPATFMLVGLILRGVAFDFRAKTSVAQKAYWDKAFFAGSLLTSLCQGYMLGRFVLGFEHSLIAYIFAILAALGVSIAYCLIGAAWLVYKTEGSVQKRAQAKLSLFTVITGVGIILVSLANLWANPDVLNRWFNSQLGVWLIAIPLLGLAGFAALTAYIRKRHRSDLWPLLCVIIIFASSFFGLAASFLPDIVPGQLTIFEAASAAESLQFILVGAAIVVPCICAYTAFSYWVFRGKSQALKYE
ncbi:cytochrome d ubiquinol oxidase subunit II [Marinagarivorans cellulosilyticus]|uniref:Cytochrome bd ubiquinol oxidase subunit II n=1 Tax=Marinagarivorans cellulosilyticus TaxID=2721545 RepID=A0AAN1WGM3_9GAMM|nr:cytochrome d ubiquinol oxidase subunit II [Marinagarivorans cellulosilyticus]BCD97255.1 cytochrome bd ubiquinol oxidase subunit II [Marinagarivorans cellulosilyticus]